MIIQLASDKSISWIVHHDSSKLILKIDLTDRMRELRSQRIQETETDAGGNQEFSKDHINAISKYTTIKLT